MNNQLDDSSTLRETALGMALVLSFWFLVMGIII